VKAANLAYASCVIEDDLKGDNRIKLVSRDIKREESLPPSPHSSKPKRYRFRFREITKVLSAAGRLYATTDSEAPAGAGKRGLQRRPWHLRRAGPLHRSGQEQRSNGSTSAATAEASSSCSPRTPDHILRPWCVPLRSSYARRRASR